MSRSLRSSFQARGSGGFSTGHDREGRRLELQWLLFEPGRRVRDKEDDRYLRERRLLGEESESYCCGDGPSVNNRSGLLSVTKLHSPWFGSSPPVSLCRHPMQRPIAYLKPPSSSSSALRDPSIANLKVKFPLN